MQVGTHVLGQNRLIEPDDVSTTTSELGAEVEPLSDKRDARHDDYSGSDDIGNLTLVQEIDMRVIEESLRPLARERNITPLSSNPVDQQARDEDGADERGDDTDNQRCSETAHGTVAEDQQDNTRDDSRQVTVDDGRIGFRETILDSQRQPFATAKLLLDTFVNNDVGVDGHTHRQHDTGNTRQSQHSTERNENAHQQENVSQQRDIGQPTSRFIE